MKRAVTTLDVAKLRQLTGVGVLAAKRALEASNGDFEKSVEALRKAGQKVASSKVSRATHEGAIGSYVHTNGKIACLVVVTCETDFVARSEAFRNLVHDLALHVAAAQPLYVRPEEVPSQVLDHERSIYRAQLEGMKKPRPILEKIVEGKIEKYLDESCLLRQRFVKDESLVVADVIHAAIQKLGENIQVREFKRLSL